MSHIYILTKDKTETKYSFLKLSTILETLQIRIFYLPCSIVTVNSLREKVSNLLEVDALLEGHLLITKAGSLGLGRVLNSLPSMKTTFDIVGRSFGSSCKHKSPTITHFKHSSALHV